MKQSQPNNPLKPLISIITVVFNGVKTLEESILSIKGQDYDNFEYIIIDGGSNDGTIELIKKYNNIVNIVVSEKDNGIYDAMNKGIDLARGEWIYFLGADDVLRKSLSKVAAYLTDKKKIYYGDVYRVGEKRIYEGEFSPYKLASRNINQQAIFYPATVLKKYKYNLNYRSFSDYWLNLKCYSDPEFTFQYIPVTVANFNDIDGISGRGDDAFEKDKLAIIKDTFPLHIYYIQVARNAIIKALTRIGIVEKIKILLHKFLKYYYNKK